MARLLEWANHPLSVDQDLTLRQLESAMPVRLIASFEQLKTTTLQAPYSEAVALADANGFDYLPVRNGPNGQITGVFSRNIKTNPINLESPVSETLNFSPLGPDDLISSETSLLHFVWSAHQQPRRLVLHGTKVSGIVTLSDIQKLPVRMALFSLFIHFELLLTDALRASIGHKDPFEFLPPGRAEKCLVKWNAFIAAKMDQDKLGAIDLCDKRIIAKSTRLLGKTAASIEASLKTIENCLRNPIAHGASYAETREAALETIHAAIETRQWIEELAAFHSKDIRKSHVAS